LENVIQIIQNGKIGSDQSQLMKIRDLDQVLENQYNIAQYILMFLAIDNRKNTASKYCNLSIQQICNLFSVPGATYYHKRKLYETNGIWGLVSKKTGPKSRSRIDPAIKQRIVELREKQLPCKTIKTMLNGQFLGKISENYIITSTVIPFYDINGKLQYINYKIDGEKYDIPATIDNQDNQENKVTSWYAFYYVSSEKKNEKHQTIRVQEDSRLYFSTNGNMVSKISVIRCFIDNSSIVHDMDLIETSNINIISFHRKILVPFPFYTLIITNFTIIASNKTS
jgi:hypothetical protein